MLKILHLRLANCPYKVEYLEELFPRLAKQGYNTVLLEYEATFPFRSCADFASPHAYTPAEIARIDRAATASGLATIPRGLSFSTGGLDLTDPAVLDRMVKSGEELLAAHPASRIIHFGGDEMASMTTSPAALRAVLEIGRSGLYVRFANRLAAEFAKRGVRVGIWSDMLIRHPQAIDELDKSLILFYWDYWSYGERTPFVSLGGGCPDMVVLDRAALPGSLRKLFAIPSVRDADEIPIGHLERFGSYWRLDPQHRSAASFPYLKWLKEKGLTVIASCLPYPEKGSFLPNFQEKMEHLRWFSKRLHEGNGDGFMACLWQPYWPSVESCMPSFLAALELMENPEQTDDAVFRNVAVRVGGSWTPAAVAAFMDAGEGFEFADTLNPLWGRNDLTKSQAWLERAGMLDADLEMAERCAAKIRALLTGEWRNLPADAFVRFVLEDMAWRAECELAVHARDQDRAAALHTSGLALQSRFAEFARAWHKDGVVTELLTARYEPWLKVLCGVRKA